jgi:hypothetical protein
LRDIKGEEERGKGVFVFHTGFSQSFSLSLFIFFREDIRRRKERRKNRWRERKKEKNSLYHQPKTSVKNAVMMCRFAASK